VILVDTSVWIELLNGELKNRLAAEHLLRFVTCGPITQEVLQGLRQEAFTDGIRQAFLAIPHLCDPIHLNTFLEAAEIYRYGRRSGYTIRSSTDCLIAAIAIENNVPVWHRDRDFRFIARYTRLEARERL
jgi:predicted nucleic acid-binding protein